MSNVFAEWLYNGIIVADQDLICIIYPDTGTDPDPLSEIKKDPDPCQKSRSLDQDPCQKALEPQHYFKGLVGIK